MATHDHAYHARTARLLALFALGAHYHSGQQSRGYRISCRAQRLLERDRGRQDWLAVAERVIERDENLQPHNQCDVARLYWQLAERHGGSL